MFDKFDIYETHAYEIDCQTQESLTFLTSLTYLTFLTNLTYLTLKGLSA